LFICAKDLFVEAKAPHRPGTKTVEIDVSMPDFRGAKRKRCVNYFTPLVDPGRQGTLQHADLKRVEQRLRVFFDLRYSFFLFNQSVMAARGAFRE
jgi:hypothetical protein